MSEFTDYKVADIALAAWGRKEIELAEHEMPGLMALRQVRRHEAPHGRPHHGQPAHDHPDRRAHRDPGRDLGAEVRWVLQHLLDPGPRRRRRGRGPRDGEPQGHRVYAWKGETLEEYWWCTEQALMWPDGGKGPNMLLDDGGDATLLVHKGVELREGRRPRPRDRRTTKESALSSIVLGRTLQATTMATSGPGIAGDILGVTEETTTGVHRLYEMAKAGTLLFPAINVNDSVTKSKFDNQVRLPPSPWWTASSAPPTS
jgi:adenosylhomocysteinase